MQYSKYDFENEVYILFYNKKFYCILKYFIKIAAKLIIINNNSLIH
jgi:hypothetical protein